MNQMKRCYHLTGNYFHFSSHVYVPDIKRKQLQVIPKYLNVLLDDIWCYNNKTSWECPLLPDWSSKIKFICDNSTCIEHCSLKIKANLEHYLVYVGILIMLSIVIVWSIEKQKKIFFKKQY